MHAAMSSMSKLLAHGKIEKVKFVTRASGRKAMKERIAVVQDLLTKCVLNPECLGIAPINHMARCQNEVLLKQRV